MLEEEFNTKIKIVTDKVLDILEDLKELKGPPMYKGKPAIFGAMTEEQREMWK